MMYRTDDPLRDFRRHDREEAEWLERRPVCDICGQAIQEDTCYLINDELICRECLDRDYKVRTEDYAE